MCILARSSGNPPSILRMSHPGKQPPHRIMFVHETTHALSKNIKDHRKDQQSAESNTGHLVEAVGDTLTNQPRGSVRRHAVVPKVTEHDGEDAGFNADFAMRVQQVSERNNVDINETEDDEPIDQ